MNEEPEELEELKTLLEEAESEKGNYPVAPNKENLFKFFNEIIHHKDNKKISNLKNLEIGNLSLPVRSYLELSKYADVEGLSEVRDYLNDKAEIILTTSNSRDGNLVRLFVTQIKKTVKETPTKIKKRFFGDKVIQNE